MLRRPLTVGLSMAVAVGGYVVLPTAEAATGSDGSTLYVNNRTTTGCSDSTTDSSVTPYCTVQAAADVVEPGQTVKIVAGAYAGTLTISRSGTAAEPIRFEGSIYTGNTNAPTTTAIGVAGTGLGAYGLVVSGASNVEVSGIAIGGGTSGSVFLTGGSSAIQLDRDQMTSRLTGVQVDSSVANATITENLMVNQPASGVIVDGASGTDVTANTMNIQSLTSSGTTGPGVTVIDGATGTTVENNIIENTKMHIGVLVDAASAPTTKLDYNIVWLASSTTYEWAGVDYGSASALAAAVGQGAHDVNTSPALDINYVPREGSPAIGSGDADAPGELSTDYYGNVRSLDPNDPVTGTGGGRYDRGAAQIVDPIALGLGESVSWAAGSFTDTFTPSFIAAPWSATVSYAYDFGDGSSQTTDASSITHTYTAPGTYKVTVTATDADGGVATASNTATVGNGNAYYPLTPSRVLDTRSGVGTGKVAQVPAHGSIALQLSGVGAFPASGAVAAVLNVTVVAPGSNGFLSVYPDSATVPGTSNLNFQAGENVPNLVTVQVAANGKVDFYNGGSQPTDVLADLEGYYAPGTGSSYTGIFPTRAGSNLVTAGSSTPATVDVTSLGGELAPEVTAVALNVTVTQGTANGYLTVYPEGKSVPATSNLNYSANENVANMVIVPVGPDGNVELYAGGKTGSTVRALIDVEGYYSTSNNGSGFTPITPTRLIDTRSGVGLPSAGQTCCVQVLASSLSAIPTTADGIVTNTTVVNPSGNGVLSAYYGDSVNTSNSNINFMQGQNVPNMIMLPVFPRSADGFLDFSIPNGVQADIVVDMFGYFS